MGLTSEAQRISSAKNLVAVEFDIWTSDWDPHNISTQIGYNHVGININSMASVDTVEWSSNISIMEGRQHEASITYDSNSKILNVNFTSFSNGTYSWQRLSHVVDFRQLLPESVYFGFSGGCGVYSTEHIINSWGFSSTMRSEKLSNRNKEFVIGLAIGGPLLLIILGLTIFVFWKKRKGTINEEEESFGASFDDEFEQGTGPKKFSHYDLAQATNNFAEQEKLGEGGFGGVYKGFLKGIDIYIAFKRVSRGSYQGVKEYASEMKIISRLRHRNLVQLLGWCHEKKELLVYEFMPNGSLDHHLFKGKSLLSWATRFKIAQGLTSGLLYLHEEWEQCVVHRDIKSSNVMLDANFNAKLGDFGLARLVDHEKGSQTTVVAGTRGYIAPEYFETGKASKESDVFSFGVMALEIACGRLPIDPSAEESRANLVEWVWNLYGRGSILDAADPQLNNKFDKGEMEQLMIVGLWCAHPDSNQIPSIRQANQVLNFEYPLPFLPIRRPVPSYFTPTSYLSHVSDNTQT